MRKTIEAVKGIEGTDWDDLVDNVKHLMVNDKTMKFKTLATFGSSPMGSVVHGAGKRVKTIFGGLIRFDPEDYKDVSLTLEASLSTDKGQVRAYIENIGLEIKVKGSDVETTATEKTLVISSPFKLYRPATLRAAVVTDTDNISVIWNLSLGVRQC